MSRAQAFQSVGEITSMQMSPDNSSLAVGGKQMIKIMAIKTESENWFENKKVMNRHKGPSGEKKTVAATALSWNKDMKLAIATTFNSIFIYDFNDFNKNKYDNMIQIFDDGPAFKIGWDRENINTLIASSTSQFMNYDIRSQQISARIQIEQLSDYQYNPINTNLVAIASKSDKVFIYDLRKPQFPVLTHDNLLQSQQYVTIYWNYDGSMLSSAAGKKIRIWNASGNQLESFGKIYHPDVITSFKWLKTSQFLILQNTSGKIIKYEEDNTVIGQYLTYIDNKYAVTSWIMDQKEDVIITACQQRLENQSVVMAQFTDNIFCQRQSKFNYPLQFNEQDKLLFNVKKWNKKRVVTSYPTLLTNIQNNSIALQEYNYESEYKRRKLLEEQFQKQRISKTKKKIDKSRVKKKVSEQGYFKSVSKEKKHTSSNKNVGKSEQELGIQKKRSADNDKKKKNPKKSMRVIHQDSKKQSDSEQSDRIILAKDFILSPKQQLKYLFDNYRMDISQENWKEIVQHNSQVAYRINKNSCAQFWKLLFTIASPEQEATFTISDIYEENRQYDISFANNKITLSCEKLPEKDVADRKKIITQMLQNLVDENQLQTAVIASCLLIKLYPTQLLLDEMLFNNMMRSYKSLLRTMGLSLSSIKTSQIIKIGEYDIGYNITYQFKVKCSLCGKRSAKCSCAFVCIFCKKQLKQSFITICKICGHGGHALQYRKWFIEDGNKFCPYGCRHQCFADKFN